MILIDSNSLVILLLGFINPKLIDTHKRTSIYSQEDFYKLYKIIQKKGFDKLIVLPNIWTEVDNLLNKNHGYDKYNYVEVFKKLVTSTTEKYLSTKESCLKNYHQLYELGLTDTLILEIGKDCDFIITSDSVLSDYANALGIKVYDMVLERNKSFYYS